jgi:transposase
MDFHLDALLNLPNVTVFTYYQKEGFIILKLELLNEGIQCPHCQNYTDHLHQTRSILVRDLSIFGQSVYLQVPRRQFYCQDLKGLKNRCLLLKNGGEIIEEERKELEELLNQSPSLTIAYELKEELRDIYETSTTVKMGIRQLEKWLIYARCFFGKTAETLTKHIQEICHYFINRTTSGVMEGINNKIKLIIRQSYGFKTFNSLRLKLLACLF